LTYSYSNKNKEQTLSAESVAAYLAANPEFFTRNQSVLKQLLIPHAVEGNVHSLIERQVALLREENNELKKLIKQNDDLSITQRHLQQHIYQFTFELQKVESMLELYRLLCLSLGKWFAANWVKMIIFNVNLKIEHIGGIHFLNNDSKVRFMFTELLNRNKPLCSSLQTEQIQLLFSKDTDLIKSNLVIPIKQAGWNGLFVLGSSERDQYGVGEELDMLVFISELVSIKLQQLIVD
jgi:uncharacterized protein